MVPNLNKVSLSKKNIINDPILGLGGQSEWIGDGFCDDINNNEYCDFDNGDCCGTNVEKKFCIDCKCISKCSERLCTSFEPFLHLKTVKKLTN